MSKEIVTHTSVFFEQLTFKLYVQGLKDKEEQKQLKHWMQHALQEEEATPLSHSSEEEEDAEATEDTPDTTHEPTTSSAAGGDKEQEGGARREGHGADIADMSGPQEGVASVHTALPSQDQIGWQQQLRSRVWKKVNNPPNLGAWRRLFKDPGQPSGRQPWTGSGKHSKREELGN
jgi:hypothetical protein